MFRVDAKRAGWWEVGAKVTDPVSGRAKDVTGKAVSLRVRKGSKSTDALATVEGGMTQVVNGPGGEVSVGGRISTAGDYYGTLSVGSAADGAGWPVSDVFMIRVSDCP